MQTKIDVLKKAVEALEDGKYYNWLHQESCNCGLVAQAALNCNAYTLFSRLRKGDCIGAWGSVIDYKASCSVTGLPLTDVFNTLSEIGFTKKDLKDLEFMDNKQIMALAGIDPLRSSGVSHYQVRENLIKYLRAWIQLLEQEQPRQAKIQPSVKIRYVKVSPVIEKMVTVLN